MREQRVSVVGRWLWCLLLLGLVSPTYAASEPTGDDELRGLLQKLARRKEPPRFNQEKLFQRLGLEEPYRVIMRAALERPEPAYALTKLQERYTLNAAAARELLLAQLLVSPPDDRTVDTDAIRRALGLYLDAAHQAPGNTAVLAAMMTLPGTAELAEGEFDARVLEALNAAPSPVETAIQLSRGGPQLYGWEVSLAAYAVTKQRDTLPRALESFGFDNSGHDATLFYFAAVQALRSQKAELPSALAERLLHNLLDDEHPALAVKIVRQLPDSQREQLLASKEVTPKDPRLDVAAALLDAGDTQAARAWFEAARRALPPEDPEQDREAAEARIKSRVLGSALEPKPDDDPFEFLLTMPSGLYKDPWVLLVTRQFQPVYPDHARQLLSWRVEVMREVRPEEPLHIQEQLSFLDDARAAFAADRKERLARFESALAALPPKAGNGTPDPLASRIRELIATPPASPFTELPRAEVSAPKAAPRWSPVQGKLNPPPGFRTVRAERSGKRVVLLALSQRLDPAGEVSGGGYWLLESKDGGKTWGSLLYTGLRQYRPYELAEKSSLPMLDGDTLRLEASVRELEEKSITFPPIGLSLKREQTGLVLQAPLADLRKDSDQDGLPDLVEARLFTDPNTADTDADGLSDGEDLMPHVSARRDGEETPESLLLTETLRLLRGGERGPPGLEAGLLRLPKNAPPESRYDALFLEMDRSHLRGVRAPSRTVVLTPEELEEAQKHLGQFYPLRIELFFNRKGDQVLIEWSEHWRGGSFLGHKQDGKWVLESRGGWIT